MGKKLKGFERGRWWGLTDSEGNFKMSTSNPREIAQVYEEGDVITNLHFKTVTKSVVMDPIKDLQPELDGESIAEVKAQYEEDMKEWGEDDESQGSDNGT